MSIQTIRTLAQALLQTPQDDRQLAGQIGTVIEERDVTNTLWVRPADEDFERAVVERDRETNHPTAVTLVLAAPLTLGEMKAAFDGYWESPPVQRGGTRQAAFTVPGTPYRVRIFVNVDDFKESTAVKSLRLFREKGFE